MSRQPEAIGLFANRDLRVGPDSLLIRFIRELEPYLRHVLKPDIYALEGTYRALLRYGLLHDYPQLYPLPSGRRGGWSFSPIWWSQTEIQRGRARPGALIGWCISLIPAIRPRSFQTALPSRGSAW